MPLFFWTYLVRAIEQEHPPTQHAKFLKCVVVVRTCKGIILGEFNQISDSHWLPLVSLFQGGKGVVDPGQVRTAGVCGTPPDGPGDPAPGGGHARMAAVCSDGQGSAQTAAAPGPQHQGADQRCPGWGPFAASHGPPRRLSAGRRGHDPAAHLGELNSAHPSPTMWIWKTEFVLSPQYGIDVRARDHQGQTAMRIARKSASRGCMDILLQHDCPSESSPPATTPVLSRRSSTASLGRTSSRKRVS